MAINDLQFCAISVFKSADDYIIINFSDMDH